MVCGVARGKAKARISLFAAAGGFVKDGAVDFRDNDVVAASEVEGV